MPAKSARGPYVPTYDANGKISNWSCLTEDGQMLKHLVENGKTDGLTPKTLMVQYPTFGKYTYQVIQSALKNARNQFDKEVLARENLATSQNQCKISYF